MEQTEVEILAVSPKIAKRMLSCGTTRLYDLLNSGELQSYRDGKSRKVLIASLQSYVRRRLDAEKSLTKSSWTARATNARAKKNTHS
ncbi:helix-turn-helix domain-containing protein [Tardiphaga sp. vice352]|uniref:helix-turn-helix domain-containing protein n=1 Tax=unclassified Tardiphaga TaxID=2631404 RepID=UPI001164A2F9|nr:MULTISPECIES: helix-turn-helix domain-containing protein [unclassified Tardiphaga]QDM25229.1 helix-turn-helix domain-containing protein [Tardiphaga sp. vice304]QDM30440.1 helix-turn-helix domain-containing protein [Tardiphaga sp. vice352]